MPYLQIKKLPTIRVVIAALASVILMFALVMPASARNFRINKVDIQGNYRIEGATIISLAGVKRGTVLSAAQINDAIQRIRTSDLFESVDADVRGSTLVLKVVEFPTVNKVVFEGNSRLKDDNLMRLISTSSRRVYSAEKARADTRIITQAYADQGRIQAVVTPRIIRRSENRIDVVFEIQEGGVVEIERIAFVGNRSFSDRRLRRILGTKQAGVFRLLVSNDTFAEDRIEFDKQVLRDFYQSNGYVDFQVLDANAELSPEQNGFFLTFRVREGQQFKFGDVTVSSNLSDVDSTAFESLISSRVSGRVYSPTTVENTIVRMESRAVEMGLNFIRVEPRINRNDVDQTLDIEYVLSRGPKVFVERIDIEGNTTTQDRVVRRQFDVVEGDPFNPRQIRASAERVRALGFFADANVKAREGSDPSSVVIDVDVTEQPTGSLSFGANYNSDNGVGLLVNFRESNFLGRGQSLSLGLLTGAESSSFRFSFAEPALLDRNLRFGFDFNYGRTDNQNALYDTETISISPSLGFPVSQNGRLNVRAFYEQESLFNVTTPSGVIRSEAMSGKEDSFGLGYSYSYDTRRAGREGDPYKFLLRFGQDYTLSGDQQYMRTTFKASVETTVFNDAITLSATLDAGALTYSKSVSRVTDRFFTSSSTFRGFGPAGVGPREINGTYNDALGGNYFAVTRLEARFPLGIPEEYGIQGGAFVDFGSVWGLDAATKANATGDLLYDDFSLRTIAGVSLFWKTPLGPLRFNFTRPISVETYDQTDNFNLTISASF